MKPDQKRVLTAPKILIFSQTFNHFSGGGITLTSLFMGYPKEKLAVLTYPFMLFNVSFDTCDTYYQIGREEYVWRYPFNHIKMSYESGLVERREPKNGNFENTVYKPSLRNKLSSSLLTPTVKWLGLSHCISRITFSERLMNWLDSYAPDILYLQISNRESILFSLQLQDYLKIPVVIHMMDDWPATIASCGPLNRLWKSRINRELRTLFNRADLCLSISDTMSEEYQERYGLKFIPFHNPIDVTRFVVVPDNGISASGSIRILYLGRIGTANHNSLLRFARIVSTFQYNDYTLEFHIYTKDTEHTISKKIRKLHNSFVWPAVDHDKVPGLMTMFDLLLLPLDFSSSGQRFSRLSMPTKASEYMISGTPMIVFAPASSAISRFCSLNQCGHCITTSNREQLKKELIHLVSDSGYRRKIGIRARELASELFDRNHVSKNFQELMIELNLK